MNDKVLELLAQILQIDIAHITDNTKMKDVETWDSLKHMEIIASLEQAFGVEFTFEEIVSMQSIGQIKHVLIQKGVTG